MLAPVTARGLPPYEDDAVHGPNAQKAAIQDVATRNAVPLAKMRKYFFKPKSMCDLDHRQGFILVIFGNIAG